MEQGLNDKLTVAYMSLTPFQETRMFITVLPVYRVYQSVEYTSHNPTVFIIFSGLFVQISSCQILCLEFGMKHSFYSSVLLVQSIPYSWKREICHVTYCSFLRSSVLSLPYVQIFSSVIVFENLNLCSSLTMKDQQNTTGKIIFLCILVFGFLNDSQQLLNLN